MGKGMTRYTDLVSGAVWWCFLGSPVLDQPIMLLQVQDHTPFSGHVPPLWAGQPRWEGEGMLTWPVIRCVDGWTGHPAISVSACCRADGFGIYCFEATASEHSISCDVAQLYHSKSWVTQLFNRSRIYPLQVGNKRLLKYLMQVLHLQIKKDSKAKQKYSFFQPYFTSWPFCRVSRLGQLVLLLNSEQSCKKRVQRQQWIGCRVPSLASFPHFTARTEHPR